MDAVALDAGEYGGTYKRVGGQLSLDFVNTVSWPGTARVHDWLDRSGNVTKWGVAVGVMSPDDGRRLDGLPAAVLRAQLAHVRRIRTVVADVLRPLAHGSAPGREEIGRLDRLAGRASRRRRIDPVTLQWTWLPPATLSEMLGPVIWNAAEVLAASDHTRLRHCAACDWLFYDATRNRSRRWCDMADCGSRDKSLRYYYRQKEAET